jgi:hypothetical protein
MVNFRRFESIMPISTQISRVLALGQTERRNEGWTNIGVNTTLMNTSSTWSVVNAVFNTASGWFGILTQESTPTRNLFSTFKANGFNYNQYLVLNQTTNSPIAGISNVNSTFSTSMHVWAGLSNGSIARAVSPFTSTWGTAVSPTRIWTAGFFTQFNEIESSQALSNPTYAYGKNSSNQGVMYYQTFSGNSTMAEFTAYTRTDGQMYTAGTWYDNTPVLGTDTGNLVSVIGGTLTTWTAPPGSGPITSLWGYGSRLFFTRGTAGGQIYYATSSNPGSYTTVTVSAVSGASIAKCMDTSTHGNYTAKFYYDPRNNAMLMTGNKCSVWYSLDNGDTWSKSSLSDTTLGNSAYGYVRLTYNSGWDEWSGVVAGREDGNRTGSLLRHHFWAANPIL